MSFEVRRATTTDAGDIARLHVATWRETYAHLVPTDQLEELAAPDRLARRAERWGEMIDSGQAVWICVTQPGAIGFASLGEERDDRPRPTELGALYVLAEHHGTGAGQALLDAALGDSPAFLFVAADNPRATRFYERNGFAFDGVEEQHTLVRTPVRALRMVR